MNWDEFQKEAPELADFGRERLERSGLVLVGTLRKDGWPRISAVEPLITDGQLYLGMMWRSRKALDLLRDPRCTLHPWPASGARRTRQRSICCLDHGKGRGLLSYRQPLAFWHPCMSLYLTRGIPVPRPSRAY